MRLNKIKSQILKSFLDHAMEIEFYPIFILMKLVEVEQE